MYLLKPNVKIVIILTSILLILTSLFIQKNVFAVDTAEQTVSGDIVYEETYLFYPVENDIDDKQNIKESKGKQLKDKVEKLSKVIGEEEIQLILEAKDDTERDKLVKKQKEKLVSENVEVNSYPAGVATISCSKSGRSVTCNWSGTLVDDYIIYSYMHLDWFLNDIWTFEHKFVYPVNPALRTIKDQGTLNSAFAGTIQAYLNGSVEGRKSLYQLISWSKNVEVY